MADHELTTQLERMLLRELVLEWRRINAAHFKEALVAPALRLAESTAHLGRWHGATRTLEISRPLVVAHPWGAVVEVLKHEMAHQYVDEVLKVHDESAHGKAFRDVCARWGIDASAAGVPDATSADDPRTRVIERVARLLALAESPNVHEAEAAMAAAQRLMLKYNVELRSDEMPKNYVFRHLGEPSGRVGESERVLASILAKHFFVEVIWVPVYRAREGKRGTVLEVCGAPENLAMAEYAHAFLQHTARELWDEHKRRTGERSNRERRTFLAGVMTGFADKLARGAQKSASEGLVWIGDRELHRYYRARHPYIRNVRYGGQRRTEAFASGKEAGKKIVLNKPMSSAARDRGRLLPP
ncbi:MAG TPA: DUF2786 domain-containing protein [Polyangiaceae bacterium]